MDNNIILYSQPGCGQCRMVHILLDKKGITYQEIQDIDVMREKGIDGTPAIEVDGKILTGPAIGSWINGIK